jgi:excinuclease UvrABC nuclease subunit
MKQASQELEFERAADIRDQIQAIKEMIVFEL